MALYLQYLIVFVIVAGAGWVSWRKLSGKHVLRRGRKADGCASCSTSQTDRQTISRGHSKP